MRSLLTAIILAASVSFAHAGPKEEAREVVANWGKAFTDGDVGAISKLYAPDALMIGTLGKVVLTQPEDIRKYFEVAFKSIDKPRTANLDSSEAIVVDDTTVLIAGFDTITGTRDGQQITAKGRVTFVLAKRGSDWVIVHLHRSPMPQN